MKPTARDSARARIILAQISGHGEDEHRLDMDAIEYL
jgi:hypothetical protein